MLGIYSSALALPATLFYVDVRAMTSDVSESSLTEIAQLFTLTATACLWLGLARTPIVHRRLGALAAMFFLSMIARESDAFFDSITDGLWQWMVSALALLACFVAAGDLQRTT